MVALLKKPQPQQQQGRLTLETADIAEDTMTIRSLDWDRDRFDIEFELLNGTTYNSFIIKGEKTALIDTSHAKFKGTYLDKLKESVDLSTLDYLIISHTEPDHSGLVKEVLELAPQVTVVASKVAIQFLENMVHTEFKTKQVKSGDRIDLGKGHELEIISAPNLHWPDTIFTYDYKTGVLFTCDAFGMHYCDESTYDEDPELLEKDFKIYYDCLMGPNARSVLSAIKRIEKLPLKTIAVGHGPLLNYHLTDWVQKYKIWSEEQAKTAKLVSVFYEEDYGNSEQLAKWITQGLLKTEIPIELIDLATTEAQEIREWVDNASGIIIGMPSQSGKGHTALSTILASANPKQSIGLFETGGGDDEPIYPLRNQFQEIGLMEAFPPILVKEGLTKAVEKICEEAGTDMGQWLNRDRTIKQMKSLDNHLDRALGRLSGGLYIITASKDNASSAMLASWVLQASVEPLGVAIAVAKDRAIETLLQVGDRFVLNILEENNYQPLMKHFLKRFSPGADRFAGIKTYPAENGSPILADALAYLECEVTSRLDGNDHWLIYSNVTTGRVAKADALTAVHHRKVGNHY